MAVFSKISATRLGECHPDLQFLFNTVIKKYNCAITCGYRGEIEQNAAYKAGLSKCMFPNSKHNSKPARGVDVVPYPVDWNDTARFRAFAKVVILTADALRREGRITHAIRWGGDWNTNGKEDDFWYDRPHFELV